MVQSALHERSCTQRPPPHHTRATLSSVWSQTPVLRIGSAVSAPRLQASHVAPVPWCHIASMLRSPRRSRGLPRAQRLPVDRGVHAGRAAAASCGTSERRAVGATSSIVVRTRAPCAPDGSQEVSGASTVDSPAARTCDTMSALAARAVAAARGGSSST